MTFSDLEDDGIRRAAKNAKRLLAQTKFRRIEVRTHALDIMNEKAKADHRTVSERRRMVVNHLDLLNDLQRGTTLKHTVADSFAESAGAPYSLSVDEDAAENAFKGIDNNLRSTENQIRGRRTTPSTMFSRGGDEDLSRSTTVISTDVMASDVISTSSAHGTGSGQGSSAEEEPVFEELDWSLTPHCYCRVSCDVSVCPSYLFDNCLLCTSLITFDVTSVGAIQCSPVSQVSFTCLI